MYLIYPTTCILNMLIWFCAKIKIWKFVYRQYAPTQTVLRGFFWREGLSPFFIFIYSRILFRFVYVLKCCFGCALKWYYTVYFSGFLNLYKIEMMKWKTNVTVDIYTACNIHIICILPLFVMLSIIWSVFTFCFHVRKVVDGFWEWPIYTLLYP